MKASSRYICILLLTTEHKNITHRASSLVLRDFIYLLVYEVGAAVRECGVGRSNRVNECKDHQICLTRRAAECKQGL